MASSAARSGKVAGVTILLSIFFGELGIEPSMSHIQEMYLPPSSKPGLTLTDTAVSGDVETHSLHGDGTP